MDDGFADLIAKLDAVKGDALKRAERKALKRVGEIVMENMLPRIHDQDGVPEGILAPGELKASIKARVHIASDERSVSGDNDRVTIGPVGKGPQAVANWLEHGHNNPRAKKGLKRTPAYPFIRPSQDATEQRAIDAYVETMTAEIEKAME